MKQFFKRIFLACIKFLVVSLLLSFLWVLCYKYLPPPITGMMLYKWIEKENYSIENDWKSLEEIDASFPLAFIASEDQKFLTHNGFDITAIRQAIKENKTSSRAKGASTISQQVAKNVFLIPTRSYLRKGLEVYFTGLIELVWGKRRIMEVYLNIVELGDGVYGVESACQKYFKKSSNNVAKREAALVAVTLPNPLRIRLDEPSAYMEERSSWVLRQMINLGGERILLEWYE